MMPAVMTGMLTYGGVTMPARKAGRVIYCPILVTSTKPGDLITYDGAPYIVLDIRSNLSTVAADNVAITVRAVGGQR